MKFIIPAAALFALTSAAVIPQARDVPSLVELDKADPDAFKFFVRSDVKDEAEILSARSSEEQPTPTADELVVRAQTDPLSGDPSPVSQPIRLNSLEDRATPTEDELVVRAQTDPLSGDPSPVTQPHIVTPLPDRATPLKKRAETPPKPIPSTFLVGTDPLPPPKKNGSKKRGASVESAEKREESGTSTSDSISKRSLTDNADLEDVINLLNGGGVSKRQPEGGDKLQKLPRSSSSADSGPNEASLVARNEAADLLAGATLPRPKFATVSGGKGVNVGRP
ncbi:hypothetical protein HYFRA_00011031 [Hymenoscyphus fraxineus]|uniref:Uncharacterized protein n=1 Tax=Hymenoscyphus fraxineus TaxID=746836 RepID=A0A9N9PLG5_9HELO|nr:hypothetical protein HYFRA_00011031 [Hymenoscyphus fraxineus]